MAPPDRIESLNQLVQQLWNCVNIQSKNCQTLQALPYMLTLTPQTTPMYVNMLVPWSVWDCQLTKKNVFWFDQLTVKALDVYVDPPQAAKNAPIFVRGEGDATPGVLRFECSPEDQQ